MNGKKEKLPIETEIAILSIIDREQNKKSKNSFLYGFLATVIILPLVYFGISHMSQLAAKNAAISEIDKHKGAWESTFDSIIDKAATSVIEIEGYKVNADAAANSADKAAKKLKEISNDISKALGYKTKEALVTEIAKSLSLKEFYLPIGSITAWHKNFVKNHDLPNSWIECNGQTVSDQNSPLFGEIVPNLNGEGLFLRGGVKSGTIQPQDWKTIKILSREVNSSGRDGRYTHGPINIPKNTDITKEIFAGYWKSNNANVLRFQFDKSEIRPKNMSIVWIIKIK